MDYSITWAYIVEIMKSKFGVGPDDETKHSMYEIEKMLDIIWSEHVDKLDEYYSEKFKTGTT